MENTLRVQVDFEGWLPIKFMLPTGQIAFWIYYCYLTCKKIASEIPAADCHESPWSEPKKGVGHTVPVYSAVIGISYLSHPSWLLGSALAGHWNLEPEPGSKLGPLLWKVSDLTDVSTAAPHTQLWELSHKPVSRTNLRAAVGTLLILDVRGSSPSCSPDMACPAGFGASCVRRCPGA